MNSPDNRTHSPSQLGIHGARQHNLKNISLKIPHNAVTVITGVSGSGKSSLAFDTLFAEGQWRYVESLSTYARMFIQKLDRPDVDRLLNIRPAIALEQKNPVRTARSTVGTSTEIADLLRLLFAKISQPVCPNCSLEGTGWDSDSVVHHLLEKWSGERAMIMFSRIYPGVRHAQSFIRSLLTKGYVRIYTGTDLITLDADTPPPLKKGADIFVVLDRLIVNARNRTRLVEGVETAFREGQGTCRIHVMDKGPQIFTSDVRCPQCGMTFEPVRPINFSFNHPLGACPDCKGFGNILHYTEDLVIPDPTKSLSQGAIEPWTKPGTDWWQQQMLLAMKQRGVNLTTPYEELPDKIKKILWAGDRKFDGVNDFFEYLEHKRYKLHVRVFLSRYRNPTSCPTCHGTRLKPNILHRKIQGLSIHDLSELTIADLNAWCNDLTLSPFESSLTRDLIRLLKDKLGYLLRVGLGYLTLSRQTRTLSGGEAQRILLANQLGSKLTGTLYVLDEPTIGLHARDTETLGSILRELSRANNTVVVVEHDRQMIGGADWVVELGPWAGEKGGEIVCSLPATQFIRHEHSLTARYLREEESIPLPHSRRKGTGNVLTIAGACEHNLKNLLVNIPLGMLVCITGVSGSGKSTLVEDTLYRAVARAFRVASLPMGRFAAIKGLEFLQGVRLIDQSPIGRTPRSNPITYLKAFDDIRHLFASTPQARRKGLSPAHFSFNTPGGRCERCQGSGSEKLEMYFFEDMFVPCEACEGKRFRPEILSIRYRDLSIHDVLNMTVQEAQTFFSGTTRLGEKLHTLIAIGLGYLRLGQSAPTLSGGEAQRLKIAAELRSQSTRVSQGTLSLAGKRARPSSSRSSKNGGILYILDEPTTGLHLEDVKKLLGVLNRLVDKGHTIVLVEHNMDVIKTADWILDLGPEGGEQGGFIVAEGRPEKIASTETSHTGRFLRHYL